MSEITPVSRDNPPERPSSNHPFKSFFRKSKLSKEAQNTSEKVPSPTTEEPKTILRSRHIWTFVQKGSKFLEKIKNTWLITRIGIVFRMCVPKTQNSSEIPPPPTDQSETPVSPQLLERRETQFLSHSEFGEFNVQDELKTPSTPLPVVHYRDIPSNAGYVDGDEILMLGEGYLRTLEETPSVVPPESTGADLDLPKAPLPNEERESQTPKVENHRESFIPEELEPPALEAESQYEVLQAKKEPKPQTEEEIDSRFDQIIAELQRVIDEPPLSNTNQEPVKTEVYSPISKPSSDQGTRPQKDEVKDENDASAAETSSLGVEVSESDNQREGNFPDSEDLLDLDKEIGFEFDETQESRPATPLRSNSVSIASGKLPAEEVPSWGKVGIYNTGNACYRISTLQALSVFKPFMEKLFGEIDRQPREKPEEFQRRCEVLDQLRYLLKSKEREADPEVLGLYDENFRERLCDREIHPEFDLVTETEQHDAAAMVQAILNNLLGIELKEQIERKGRVGGVTYLRQNPPEAANPIVKLELGSSSDTFDDLVKKTFAEKKENADGNNPWYYENNITIDDYTSQTKLVGEPPDILAFQLERYSVTYNGTPKKNDSDITLPKDGRIDLSKLYGSEEASNYQLRSFICHLGDRIKSGHYVAYVFHDGRWYECNDSKVEPKSPAEIYEIQKKAYLLFFEKQK